MPDTKILLVDDAASMRGVVKMMLSKGNYKNITEAFNGINALQKLAETKIELIICDWDMPEMDGIELLKVIRGDDSLKHLPFIMLTANIKTEKIKLAIDAGVDDYLIKPFQPQRLFDKIRRCLARR